MLFTIFDYYYILVIVIMFLYGDKCVNYRALKETIAKTCKHIQKTRDLVDFVEKIAHNGAKCCLDSFSGRRSRGYLKFPSLGSPHGGEKWKKHPLEGSQGGNRGYTLEPLGLLPLFKSFAFDAAEMSNWFR